MDTITMSFDTEPFRSSVYDTYFDGMRYASFDIETTGLNPASSQVILSGFCEECDGIIKVTQFFAENMDEERDVLLATLRYMKDMDYILTYNGKRFDVPFALQRCEKLGICSNEEMRHLSNIYNLDLYPVAKRFSDIRRFVPNLRQTTLEGFMDLWHTRTDEIDGARSVNMYFDYLLCKDKELKEKVLLHNRDDVLQLYKLQSVIRKCSFHRAMTGLGFPVKTGSCIFVPTLIKLSRRVMRTEGRITGNNEYAFAPYLYPGDGGLSFEITAEGRFAAKVPILRKENMALADLAELDIRSDTLELLPTSGSGYLVLAECGEERNLEMNLLTREILKMVGDIAGL